MNFGGLFSGMGNFFRTAIGSFFKAVAEGFGLLKDVREIRRVGKKVKSIRCFLIVDGFVDEYRGRLGHNTNEITIDAISRSWIRDKVYNWTTKPIAFMHDSYPKTLDLNIFKLKKEDMDKYMNDPDLFYKAVDRDFSINSYQIGSAKLLENLRETPRKTLILLVALGHATGWIFCFFTIFYFLLGQ